MAKFLDPKRADDISEEFDAVCQRRLAEGVNPTTLLAGLCAGLLRFMSTAPLEQPASFTRLRGAVANCIQDMHNQAAQQN